MRHVHGVLVDSGPPAACQGLQSLEAGYCASTVQAGESTEIGAGL